MGKKKDEPNEPVSAIFLPPSDPSYKDELKRDPYWEKRSLGGEPKVGEEWNKATSAPDEVPMKMVGTPIKKEKIRR